MVARPCASVRVPAPEAPSLRLCSSLLLLLRLSCFPFDMHKFMEGGAMVGCCSRLFGFESRSFSPKIWSVSSAREEEVWFDSPRSSMGLAFRTRVSFCSGWIFLVLVVLVGRWFSFSSQSVCRWVSLPPQRALCIEFAGELVLEYNQGSCRSSSWFKGRLSMPPQLPPRSPLHLNPLFPIPGLSILRGVCSWLGMCSVFIKSLLLLAANCFSTELARWFSTGLRASGSRVFDRLL
ncbi:hypothetical protein Bca101_001970 [Brassica carinata]